MTDQRKMFETAVADRLKESGFLEVEIRVECLARCDDGYQDEVINAGWHYWNTAIAANPARQTKLRGTAAQDVVAERERQIASEGWKPEHDDKYTDHELTRAARCYLIGNPGYWPWSRDWWKPTDRRRDLVKAAALIIAEIERLDRAATTEGQL